MLTIYWDPQDQPSDDHAWFVWFDVAQIDDDLGRRILAAASRVSGTMAPCWDDNPSLPFTAGERVLLVSPDRDFFAEATCRYGDLRAFPDGLKPIAVGWYFEPDWSTLRYA